MLRYQFGEDQLPAAATITGDDGADWWAGVARCMAGVAIAAALASNAFAATLPVQWQQDEGAGLFGQADEDGWQNPVAPVPATFRVPPPWGAEQNEDAANLYGQYQDDEWKAPVPLPVVVPLQPWSYGRDDEWVGLWLSEDEWRAPVPLSVAPPVRVQNDDGGAEIVVPWLSEDEWRAPLPAPSPRPPVVFAQVDDGVAPTVVLALSEDGWNPPLPVVVSPWRILPWIHARADDRLAPITPFGLSEDEWPGSRYVRPVQYIVGVRSRWWEDQGVPIAPVVPTRSGLRLGTLDSRERIASNNDRDRLAVANDRQRTVTLDGSQDMTTADTFVLSGNLGGTNLPADSAWAGATFALTVRGPGGRVAINAVALTTWTLATKAFTYRHTGPMAIAGSYTWSIVVTFASGVVEEYKGDVPVPIERSVAA